jgi:uncharacterized protein
MDVGTHQTETLRSPALQADVQAAHGGILLAMLAVPLLVPALQCWPLYLLAPLLGYGFVVALMPALRRSLHWLRAGKLRGWVLVATAAIIALSTSALLLYDLLLKPDLGYLSSQVPPWRPAELIVAGAFFSVLNALLEEMIFRGVLLDALTSQIGAVWAVVVQAVAFGIGHGQGYPPGSLGMALAAVYGLMLGMLRQRSGGLLAPWIAHVFADAVIFRIVVAAR